MKKKGINHIWLFLLYIMAAGVLCGCFAQKDIDYVQNKNVQENNAEIVLKWAVWDLTTTPYYQSLADAYEKENPNVKVEFVDIASEDYIDSITISLSGRSNDIDIITIKDVPQYVSLVRKGQVLELNDFLTQYQIDSSSYSGTIEQLYMDERLYAMPFRNDFWVIYYNKDLFDEAGVAYPDNDMTWEEYCGIAEKMTDKNRNVYGTHYHPWRSTVQLGAILDGKNTILDGTYDFTKDFYEMALKQQQEGVCMDYAALITSSSHYSGVFYNDQIAMLPMGSWFIGTQIAAVESGESKATNWGIVKYPHAEDVEPGATIGTITSLAINTYSQKRETAYELLDFICGEKGAGVLAENGNIPAIQSEKVTELLASMQGFPVDEASKEALSTVKTYLEMPVHEKAADVEVILNEEHDKIMNEMISIDEGIENMNTRVQRLLKE